MAKVWKRGGVRLSIEGDDLVVYIDADKLLDAKEFDVPEVELVRISKQDMLSEVGRFWANVRAEWKRFNKRRKAGAKK